MTLDLEVHPHKRFNPLTSEWVLVSPHRTQRPWQGRREQAEIDSRPSYDSDCYLCPGNQRHGGQQNPDYADTFIFTNDFPALLPDTQALLEDPDDLFRVETETGICKVICFSPRHDLSVPNMTPEAVELVVGVWKDEYEQFLANPQISYVQIFENKGAIMGCSNPHPHCQVWASSDIPSIVAREQENQRQYREKHGAPLLLDYLDRELEKEDRLIYQNEAFVVLVPFWAVWPFETMILPRQHCPSVNLFTSHQVRGIADAYRKLTQAYDRVFECEFPYTAGIHQAPATMDNHDDWQWHMHFYPPLLRSATVRKFMVGYEMLASTQRDITAENAAGVLRQAMSRL